MEQIDINYQAIYYHPNNSKGVAFNLLRFGWQQFCRVHRIREMESFRRICYSKNLPDIESPDFAEILFNTLTDSIRISICVENYLKACLLCEGIIVHKLDGNVSILKTLAKDQYNRPIKLDEVKSLIQWEVNNRIKAQGKGLEYQLKGIQHKTIGMKELLQERYRQVAKMPDDIMKICSDINFYRNNLHLYTQENITISANEFDKLIKIIEFFNLHLVSRHNELRSQLGKGESYVMKPLVYL
jgi:hypothetical protein